MEHAFALPDGFRFGEYEIVRILGAGGFGITYLGYDHNLHKAVAIKEYFPNGLAVRKDNTSVVATSSAGKEDFDLGLYKFLEEARTLAKFDHPNLPKVYRFFDAYGTGYFVMEYIEGTTLSDLYKQKGFIKEAEIKQIIIPLLEGLEIVHQAGYLHRDIKPDNIVIRDDGSPVLIDFGSARAALGMKSLSVTSIITPGYAPIEQYSSKSNQSVWTDIYALGAVIYQGVCGNKPDDATDRIREDPLKPAVKVGAGKGSNQFLEAVDWALCVHAKDRPQAISEWRDALNGVVSRPEPVESEEPTEPKKWIVPVMVIMVAVAGAGFWVWQSYFSSDPMPPIPESSSDLSDEKLVGEVFRDCDECPGMVVVPSGSYRMGSAADEADRDDDEGPVRTVTIPANFAVGQYEVSFEEWEVCVSAGGCGGYQPDDQDWGRGRRPMINVSWEDAKEYVRWLSDKTGYDYGLLSESEWEYVARAGIQTVFHTGDQITTDQANFDGRHAYNDSSKGINQGKTIEVGSFSANSYGLHDMHGNVWEWVEDCWNDSYSGAPTDGSARTSGDCKFRVLRGGSWSRKPWNVRLANRFRFKADDRNDNNGFRVSRKLIR